MQQNELPKAVKRAMRPVVGLAHEAELRQALEQVYGDFQKWKAGTMDSFELTDRIHEFHNGPNRDIYLRYSTGLDPRFVIENALEEGTIEEDAVPREIWPYLKGFSTKDPNSSKG